MNDSPNDLESKKQTCFDLAAAAFSENQLDLDGYEVLAGQIAGADDMESLMVIESSLPKPQHKSLETQIISCDKGRTQKFGRWLESTHVLIRGDMSRIILDFTQYAAEANGRVTKL